jgi:hypothetical protein
MLTTTVYSGFGIVVMLPKNKSVYAKFFDCATKILSLFEFFSSIKVAESHSKDNATAFEAEFPRLSCLPFIAIFSDVLLLRSPGKTATPRRFKERATSLSNVHREKGWVTY